MSDINSQMIKNLREKTGAGMMDCKRALVEAAGDFNKAEDWLKEKGLSVANKKAGRVASEGLVATAISDNKGIIVEINSETDFVSKNQTFIDFVKKISHIALNEDTIEDLQKANYGNGNTVNEELISLISKIQENLMIRKFKTIKIEKGKIFSYVHSEVDKNIGRIAVLLNLVGESDNIDDLGKKLSMHIAAFSPKALKREDLDKEIIERERKIQESIVKQTNKPKEIQDKMIEGKMNKFFQEICLLEQNYIMDDNKTVNQILLENKSNIISYLRVSLGEDIEKKTESFADEVAKVIKS